MVENARLLSLECKKQPKTDRFSATFLKNTKERHERHEREKKTRAVSFSSKKKKQKVSSAAEAKRKQKERTCFFAAFVLPSSAGVQVFHLRTQRSIIICSRGFIIRREDNEQSLTFTARNHSAKRRSRL